MSKPVPLNPRAALALLESYADTYLTPTSSALVQAREALRKMGIRGNGEDAAQHALQFLTDWPAIHAGLKEGVLGVPQDLAGVEFREIKP